jgi:hypothetical protein
MTAAWRRADRGQAVLVAARDVAGDPRLPFMITDLKTTPASSLAAARWGREWDCSQRPDRAATTEFATKVAILVRRTRLRDQRARRAVGPAASALRGAPRRCVPARWPRPWRLAPLSSPRWHSAHSSSPPGSPRGPAPTRPMRPAQRADPRDRGRQRERRRLYRPGDGRDHRPECRRGSPIESAAPAQRTRSSRRPPPGGTWLASLWFRCALRRLGRPWRSTT